MEAQPANLHHSGGAQLQAWKKKKIELLGRYLKLPWLVSCYYCIFCLMSVASLAGVGRSTRLEKATVEKGKIWNARKSYSRGT